MSEELVVFDPKKGLEKASRSFTESLATIGAILAVAFAAIPPEALSAFVVSLQLKGWVGMAAIPVLMAIQRYLSNRSKQMAKAEPTEIS